MGIWKGGAIYFAWAFAAGFVLGVFRVLWVAPHLGERLAEFLEAPVMFVVIVFAARWVTRRLRPPARARARLAVGCIALGLMLMAESAVVLEVRRLPLRQYVVGRDPVTGGIYVAMLAIFAVMPAVVRR